MANDQSVANGQILDPEIIAQKGEQIYQDKLRGSLEADHKGEYAAINVMNEEYVLGKSPEEAINKAKKKYPEVIFHLVKIGYPGVYKVSWSKKKRDYAWLF